MNLYFVLPFIISDQLKFRNSFKKKKFAGEYLLFQYSVIGVIYDMTSQNK